MKKIKKIAWAVRRWQWVGPSGRFISRVERFYLRRVHRPVRQWREFGGAFPVLPWWHQLVFSFLSVVGGRFPVKLRRGQPNPVFDGATLRGSEFCIEARARFARRGDVGRLSDEQWGGDVFRWADRKPPARGAGTPIPDSLPENAFRPC
jgi:hypothetical protein